jgi:hypothetical protein
MRSSAADSIAFACILGFTAGVAELPERLRRGELLCRPWKAVVNAKSTKIGASGHSSCSAAALTPLSQRRKDARPRRGDPQPGRGLAVSG